MKPPFHLVITSLLLLLVFSSPLPAEIEIFAEKGNPVPARVIGQHGWAPEIQAMMAHPSRTVVWKDVENQPFPDKVKVAFRPRNMEDFNDLFALFGKLETRWHRARIAPESGVPARFRGNYPKDALDCPLIFEVHSADFLKQWYLSMPVNASGQRYTHNRVFDEAPPAAEPAMILYGKHPLVELDKIVWPRWAVIHASISKQEREGRGDDPVLKEIDELAREYSAPNCEARRKRRQMEAEEGAG
ncbi:hypothetical protein [Haloferula sp.]|uniref:hypothetical protein n=1 Tax=Haloferula sp. TaxID=2497595 RepID=UPI0032A0897A